MKYLFKLLCLSLILALFIQKGEVTYRTVLVILLIIGVNVVKERFVDKIIVTIISLVLICVGVWYDRNFTFLLGIPVFDFLYKKQYFGALSAFILGIYLAEGRMPLLLFVLCISAILGDVMAKAEEKETDFKNRLDEERRLRYDLERTKVKLINASKDIAHLTEVSERNRIAREIHDNVGHSIAGLLIQLQAADKLFDRDRGKARELIELSIEGLASALTLLRDTVHNIKPMQTLGVEYIVSIIDNFGFCQVKHSFTGDFSQLASSHLEILGAIIKEALTNTARHSKALRVDICIDINEKYARVLIKDNGIGCVKIKEGLGLSGMKERVLNIGGTLSISSNKGFLIVGILPLSS